MELGFDFVSSHHHVDIPPEGEGIVTKLQSQAAGVESELTTKQWRSKVIRQSAPAKADIT